MAEEQIPQASNAQQLVLTSRNVIQSLRINDIEVPSIEEAWAVVESLPVPEKAAAITEFNTNVLEKLSGMQDELLKWSKLVGDGAKLGLSEEELKDYKSNNREFDNVIEGISKGKQDKINKIKTVLNCIDAKGQNGIAERGKAFNQFIETVCNNLGKNVYKNMHSLFKTKVSVREGIQLINEATLDRARGKKAWNCGTLTESDVGKALKRAKDVSAPGELEFKQLLADELIEGQYVFDNSGILIKGRYSDELFPAFRDEPEEWAPITISAPTQKGQAKEAEIDEATGEKEKADKEKSVEEEIAEEKGSEEANLAGEKAEGEKETEENSAGEKTLEEKPDEEKAGEEKTGDEEKAAEEEQAKEDQLSTPKGKRRSKRKADEVEEEGEDIEFTDAESVTPKRKTPSRGTPKGTPKYKKQKTYDFDSGDLPPDACKCEMPKEWKEMLGDWDNHEFDELRTAILGPIYDRKHSQITDKSVGIPCTEHCKQLGSVLGLDMELFTAENFMDQISLIYDATKDKKSISVAWIDANTREFFYTTEAIEEYRDKHRILDRFRPNLQLPVFEMDSVPNLDAISLNEKGFIYKKNHLKWIEKFDIREMLWEEINMLRFHLRKDTIKDMGDLGNGYFSLASQLLMADPLTWLGFYEASNRRTVHMIAHPRPVRYLRPGMVDCRWYEGDTNNLATTNALSSEFFLGTENRNHSYVFLSGRKKAPHFVKKYIGDVDYAYLPHDLEMKEEIDMQKYLSKADQGKNQSVIRVKKQMDAFSWMIYKSGMIGYRQFVDGTTDTGELYDDIPLSEPFVTVPMSLVAVEGGMCENGVSYDMIKTSHQELSPPVEGRFNSTEGDSKFEGTIRLEHVGAIYDMVRCDKMPHHPAVKETIAKWLNADAEQREQLHREWVENAVFQVQTAFLQVRQYEMSLFEGDRSYFRCIESGWELPVEEDPDYIVISDSD
jgi:hypothetical protein